MGAAVMWEAGRGRHWCKNEIVQMWDDAHPQLASLSRPPFSVRSVEKHWKRPHLALGVEESRAPVSRGVLRAFI